MAMLIRHGKKIVPTSVNFLEYYATKLRKEYANILSTIRSEAANGDLIELKKYVKHNVNGTFASIIRNFEEEYGKNIS